MKSHKLSLILFVALSITLTACGGKSVKSVAGQADYAELIMFSIASLEGDKEIRAKFEEKSEIMELAGIISEEDTEAFKCGYDGKIVFNKGETVLLEVDYNLNPDCQHVRYNLDGTNYFKKFTENGLDFLEDALVKASVAEMQPTPGPGVAPATAGH